VTRSIDRDRVKMVAWKEKEKESSSSQNMSFSSMGDIMFTLKKLAARLQGRRYGSSISSVR
jgi:hypothetical protein